MTRSGTPARGSETPVCESAASAPGSEPQTPRPGTSAVEPVAHAVLFVDDEPNILEALERSFFDEDYRILTAAGGEEGLKILQRETVAVIVSDQRMPGMDGARFLEKAAKIAPAAIRIMLTGHTDLGSTIESINRGGISRYLSKPWRDEELKATIRDAARTYHLGRENERLHAQTVRQKIELETLNRDLEERVRSRTAEVVARSEQLAALSGKLKESFLNGTRLLAGALHAHNHRLGEHSERVESAALIIAKTLRLQDEEHEVLGAAARLHDIGMLALPDAILEREPQSLNARQAEEYRHHPGGGYALVAVDEGYERIAIMIRHHHEAFDGSGFPDGLRSDRIPLGARILAVADHWDRLRFPRRGRAPLTAEQALEAVKRRRGGSLDPEIVNALVNSDGLDEPRANDAAGPRRIGLADLRPGMVLAADLRASNGLFLAAAGTVLTNAAIERLGNFHRSHPIVSGVLVSASAVVVEL